MAGVPDGGEPLEAIPVGAIPLEAGPGPRPGAAQPPGGRAWWLAAAVGLAALAGFAAGRAGGDGRAGTPGPPADGVPEVVVPDVVGLPADTAAARLIGAGLAPAFRAGEGFYGRGPGVVRAQEPGGGERASRGSAVGLRTRPPPPRAGEAVTVVNPCLGYRDVELRALPDGPALAGVRVDPVGTAEVVAIPELRAAPRWWVRVAVPGGGSLTFPVQPAPVVVIPSESC